jgi:hypothetical protein
MTQFNTNVPPQENSKNAAKLLIHMANVVVLRAEVSNSGDQIAKNWPITLRRSRSALGISAAC